MNTNSRAQRRGVAEQPPGNRAYAHESTQLAWFLDSDWDDPVWTLKPTNVLEETNPVRISWHFTLPSGEIFGEDRNLALLETCKHLIALIRSRSFGTGLPQRASTVAGYFMYLRELLRWMEGAGFSRFSDLDAPALLHFQHAMAQRPGVRRDALAPITVQKYLYLLAYLHHYRNELGDGLRIDPFPGSGPGAAAGVRDADVRRWPYTPRAIAVALVQGAIDLVTKGAAAILQAKGVYTQAASAAKRRGCQVDACTNAGTRALQRSHIEPPGRMGPILTVDDLALSVDMLYAACFVVIAYLVGARSSEILHLKFGCVEHRCGADDEELDVLVGSIFKRQPEYNGQPHEWVAPPVVVTAISVLEALSAGHREQSGRCELWLRRRGVSGATEWQKPCAGELVVPSAMRMRSLLRRFGAWLKLPEHQGQAWRLSTHQGRKTFARFVALRDRSALFALAEQLGHRERAVTDSGYAGSDYRLNEEIEAEVLAESVAAWEHMLSAPGLGGRAGAEIMAKRPRFRGTRLKEDIKRYARMLVDAGLTLGVCEWGYCVYRKEHSACLGNVMGPNPLRREPSVCAGCRNFVVSQKHRSWWVSQANRYEAMLNDPALPRKTLLIARQRFEEARRMIRSMDARTVETGDGKPASTRNK